MQLCSYQTQNLILRMFHGYFFMSISGKNVLSSLPITISISTIINRTGKEDKLALLKLGNIW